MGKDGFWSGKRTFVSGINGFIGSNLAKALIEKGAHVTGLLRNHDRNTLLFYENIADHCTLISGDICDKELMSRIVSEQRISVVFHLAAQVEIGVGLSNPYLTWETNVRGTYSLMEAVRLNAQNVNAVVVASTDKSYGSYSRDQMPYQEEYPLRPRYPYDTSKACADMIARSYANEVYRLPVVVTRFSNIFGPGQMNFSAVIPDAITSALKYSTFIPRGDGQQIRDFIFVDDVVELYLEMACQLSRHPERYGGEVFNAGANAPRTIRDVVQQIYTLCDNRSDLKAVLALMEGRKTTGEIDCQFMDFKKVNRCFCWSPRHSFQDGLGRTITWFRHYHQRHSMRAEPVTFA